MRKKILIGFIALMMLAMVSVPSALAYFSTYAKVKGSAVVNLQYQVEFTENHGDDDEKVITLTCTKGDVFVRVKAYAVDEVLDLMDFENQEEWISSIGNGCLIFEHIGALAEGDTVTLNLYVNGEKLEREIFNVIVIYEYVPAIGDTPDWSGEVTIVEEGE